MTRVRFAPSPTGSLHLGNALSAVANRRLGDWMLLRIDDTDPARNVPSGEEAIVEDLDWLGIEWDEGPVRQSERQDRHREAALGLGGDRFGRITLLRPDGTATYHLASVVDDIDFGITHVIRGHDHSANTQIHTELFRALGHEPPEFVLHGLILGPDGKKLSKRAEGGTVASLREAGIPHEAARAYLEELAATVGAPIELVPALRGARDLEEARETVRVILEPAPASLGEEARPTLERFRELRERVNGAVDHDMARALLRELKAVGGDLRALRVALTGRERGPELAAVVAALDRDETRRRIDAAL